MTGVVRQVSAAGGVVERDGLVAVVHRPRYDDWSLPKGKLDRGESWEQAALREVREETGLECELGEQLPTVRYMDQRGRPKTVRYWRMARHRRQVRGERRGRRDPLARSRRAPPSCSATSTIGGSSKLLSGGG